MKPETINLSWITIVASCINILHPVRSLHTQVGSGEQNLALGLEVSSPTRSESAVYLVRAKYTLHGGTMSDLVCLEMMKCLSREFKTSSIGWGL